jgi:hypothetical protein
MAPDFSVGVIEYDDGVVAWVTAGLVAPKDKSLLIIGDKGVLLVPYLRNDNGRIPISNPAAIAGASGVQYHAAIRRAGEQDAWRSGPGCPGVFRCPSLSRRGMTQPKAR